MQRIKNYLNSESEASTLAFYRLAFGLMMLFSLFRFVANGWVAKFYIEPLFHFTYYGFEWVKPFGNYTYLLFLVAGLAAFCVAIGYRYQLAIVTFFLSFTYIELIDKTTYLNHYYFISVISFMMIFLPANAYFSVDAAKSPRKAYQRIPRWSTDVLKILVAIVYVYAGLAKLNSDWLIEAMPLKIWLPSNEQLPVLGQWLNKSWVAYAFSWMGAAYDLTIVFLLLYKPTRWFAFSLVVIFHVLTKILFPIGVFPYVMIVSTLVFFDSNFHKNVLMALGQWFKISIKSFENGRFRKEVFSIKNRLRLAIVVLFMVFQLLFPFRYLAYPAELFWTEQGFRFSWRVMLMEKAGYGRFSVVDSQNGQKVLINNADFLTTFQEKQMAFQPDFILEYAHYLHDIYKNQGWNDPKVYVESYVALNGRLSQAYVNPSVDLAHINESFAPINWLLPFNDEIKGF